MSHSKTLTLYKKQKTNTCTLYKSEINSKNQFHVYKKSEILFSFRRKCPIVYIQTTRA